MIEDCQWIFVISLICLSVLLLIVAAIVAAIIIFAEYEIYKHEQKENSFDWDCLKK